MQSQMPDREDAKWPEKAYKNLPFLNSPDARIIRVLCEFVEPETRFEKLGVKRTVVFFGSARTLDKKTAEKKLQAATEKLDCCASPTEEMKLACERAETDLRLSRYYEDAALLSEKITLWAKSLPDPEKRLIVCSGGGPGIMMAANQGANRAAGLSIGLNISLPFEQEPNPFQTPELAFEFHYFFIRKFWFASLAKALVVFPGGFGTFDELFEILTLLQTRKMPNSKAVVLYGSEYWNSVVNFEAMRKWGVISPEDLDLFKVCDDVDTAFSFITGMLEKDSH